MKGVHEHTKKRVYTYILLENVEHCGGEPEQAASRFDIGFVTSKIVCQVFTRDS